jgi:hypothetical protein
VNSAHLATVLSIGCCIKGVPCPRLPLSIVGGENSRRSVVDWSTVFDAKFFGNFLEEYYADASTFLCAQERNGLKLFLSCLVFSKRRNFVSLEWKMEEGMLLG